MKPTTLNMNSAGPGRARQFFAVFGLLSAIGTAQAAPQPFDQQMQPVLRAYLNIPQALAADQTRGVIQGAKKIQKLAAKLDASAVSGKHAKKLRGIPRKLQRTAAKLAQAKGIKEMRQALKELSKPLALWATLTEPQGISVMYCSMAPGSWLQRDTTIANPYYGAKMLRCGEIVAGVGAKKK